MDPSRDDSGGTKDLEGLHGSRKPQTNRIAAARDALLKTASSIPSASEIIDATFKEDTKVQRKYSEHLAARTQKAIPNALRAHAAFTDFAPSRFTKGEREPRRYLAPGENLAATMTRLVQDGVDRVRSDTNRQGLRVELTSDFKNLLNKGGGDTGVQTIDLVTVLNIVAAKLPAAPTLRDDPALTACAATLEVQKRVDEIEGKTSAPAEKKDTSSDSAGEDSKPASAKDFVTKHVHDLLANVPSPEEPPVLVSPAAADHGQVKQNIQNFELRSGASTLI